MGTYIPGHVKNQTGSKAIRGTYTTVPDYNSPGDELWGRLMYFETESCYVDQAGLELMSDSSASASQVEYPVSYFKI